VLRQPQRQRPADHTAADNGDPGLLDSHGHLSLFENPLSLPDFFTLSPGTFILVTTAPKHYNTRPAILSTSKSMTKKLHIKTWGCQMNEYDSSKMADLLDATHGYQLTEVAEEADVLLVNPTHFAVGLYYRPDETPLPRLLFKACDEEARALIEEAQRKKRPVIRFIWLTRTLWRTTREGAYIPRETLNAVAHVYRLLRELEDHYLDEVIEIREE